MNPSSPETRSLHPPCLSEEQFIPDDAVFNSAIGDGEVHLWSIELNQPASLRRSLRDLLSDDERGRADRFAFARDRDRFEVCRGTVRMILGKYADLQPDHLRFEYGPTGKPCLERQMAGTHFNVSHSGDVALLALSQNGSIGIDVELVRPIPDAMSIATWYFSRRECETLRGLPSDQVIEAFLSCWTRKEAYLKAVGVGLSHPLTSVEVTLAPGEDARFLAIGGDTTLAGMWSLRQLVPAPGYIGALAIIGAVRRIVPRIWQPTLLDS